MNTFNPLWHKLRSKKYREEFVAAQVKRGIPFQIQALMKQHDLSQEQLALQAGLSQGVISRARNLEYGNLTLNTIIRVAAGFDVAFIGRFVPFSELGKWFISLSEESSQVKTFAQEDEEFRQMELGSAKATLDEGPALGKRPPESDAVKGWDSVSRTEQASNLLTA